jgi:hypothetical protein
MTRAVVVPWAAALGFAVLGTGTAGAQPDVPQATEQYSFELRADGLLRQEWTRNLFEGPDQDRWRIQVRPRLELGVKWLLLGVGAEFNHSEDENDVPPSGAAALGLVRDNYRSRDTRLDLAFASLKPADWLRLEGGRFAMPIAFTEMVWDRDLRPQGAALHLGGGDSRFALSVLGSRGGHPFEDDDAEMLVVAATVASAPQSETRVELQGSFLAFRDVETLEPAIRRQNTRVAPGGPLALDYRVIDAVLRLRHEGVLPWQAVADFCWNTAADSDRTGVWLALVLGSTRSSRSRLEYTYARVDKDATLAAYASDDFFWGTGWEGHRADVGIRLSDNTALHGVAQLQRFKDSVREAERDHWVRRYRAELRFSY